MVEVAKRPKRAPSGRALAFLAWTKANGLNTKRVAIQAGVSYSTLASFVQGDTQSLKGETEEKITSHYGVSAAEIFGGLERSTRTIPIIDSVTAGRLSDPISQIENGHETIEISGLPSGDYFATRVDGDSMDRLSPPGSLILVNRAEREPLPGRRYIFARRGKTTYKRFERDPVRLMPESTNPANEPLFPKSEEEWTVIGRVRLTLYDDL